MNTGKNANSRKNGRGSYPKIEIDIRYGKVPPHVTDLEQAVLGAIMLEKSAFDIVSDILKTSCFYQEKHQRIFSAMATLSSRSMPLDILSVVEQLRTAGDLDMVGGPFYVTKLTNEVVSSASIEAHSRIILQKFIQRELIRISGEIIADAYEESADVFNLLDKAENGLFEISTGHLKSNYSSISALYVKNILKIEELMRRGEDMTGVTSGYRSLDVITAGWQSTDLIIIAARPSVGKTAFALNLARNAALDKAHPTGVGIFSLEMSSDQITQRLIAMESDYYLDRIRRGKFEPDSLQDLDVKCRNTIARAPIFIDDTAAINIFELRAKARRMVAKNWVGLIIVDYLQLMSGSSDNRNGNREQDVSKIARDLKGLAKELKVPVIALSQLSREVEKRKGGEPQLSDLRESGAIEQDADLVMFLSRPDYQKGEGEIDPALSGDAELKIAKHRNGPLERIPFKANHRTQRWMDANQFDYAPAQLPAPIYSPAIRNYSEPAAKQEEDDLPF